MWRKIQEKLKTNEKPGEKFPTHVMAKVLIVLKYKSFFKNILKKSSIMDKIYKQLTEKEI